MAIAWENQKRQFTCVGHQKGTAHVHSSLSPLQGLLSTWPPHRATHSEVALADSELVLALRARTHSSSSPLTYKYFIKFISSVHRLNLLP